MYDYSTLLPSEARQIISERIDRAADARTARATKRGARSRRGKRSSPLA